MNRWHWLALLVISSLALALRLPDLGRRPLHNDESVNAIKLRDLWLNGEYRYDPEEYHGPTLHYFSLPFVRLSGAHDFTELTEAHLRLVTVAAGVGLVLLALLFADGLGRPAAVAAAALTAISPAMVFYSRYFIHEMLLVAFTALAIGASWRWWNSRKVAWAIAAGVGLGLMYATKETFVFPIGAAILASGVAIVWHKFTGSRRREEAPMDCGVSKVRLLTSVAPGRWQGIVAIFVAAAIVSILFFTSFFSNAAGLKDSFETYLIWRERAGGASPHIHGWAFYFERLLWFHQPKGRIWSEGLILLLAVVGAAAGIVGRGVPARGVWLARWLVIYTVVLTGIYCVIPYKTPWCLLGFFHGWILLAGAGAAAVWSWLHNLAAKGGYTVFMCGALGCLAWQSYLASFVFSADRQNPYVYAQTSPSLRELANRVEGISRVHPSGNRMVIQIMAPESDYWPLPYYLRALSNTDWRNAVLAPNERFAPVMIVARKFDAEFDEKSNHRWLMAGLYELRPGTFLELYVELELWKQYVAGLPLVRD